jgi:hypothetical protein
VVLFSRPSLFDPFALDLGHKRLAHAAACLWAWPYWEKSEVGLKMGFMKKFFQRKEAEGETYLLFFEGEKTGPFSKSELVAQFGADDIPQDVMIRASREKSAWRPLCEVDWLVEEEKEDDSEGYDAEDSFELAGGQTDTGPLVTCPHCWHDFSRSKVTYISKHIDLTGDPILGPEAQTRFLPTSFNEQGYAIDARGLVCQDMACPNCHLRIPEAIIDISSSLFSIVGAPASGKSYYLTAMIWRLRNILAKKFDYALADTDATFNSVLNNYEQLLFMNGQLDEYTALPKTELQGHDFSNQILLNGMSVDLPLPFIFTLTPLQSNQSREDSNEGPQNIILYDNAGEHFEPGRDQVTNLATQHLVHSDSIAFLYDPIKDSRMVAQCDATDPQVAQISHGTNQLVLLNEMIVRIKKYAGLASKQKYDKPLIVVIPKYDSWKQAFPLDLESIEFSHYCEDEMQYSLDMGAVLNVSFVMRDELLKVSPEVVATCEAFFSTVYFIPMSALGQMPEYDAEKDMIAIKPQNLKPIWAEVPMLMQFWHSGLISAVATGVADFVKIEKYKFQGDSLLYTLPGCRERETVPSHYCGRTVFSSKIAKHIMFPELPESTCEASGQDNAEVDDFWQQ